MTREEAIKVLRTESVEIGGNAVSVCRFWEALDMAVKALEDVPVVRCRECKHLGFCGDATNLEVMGFYGYCSRGERKEGTSNGIHN